MMIIMILKIIGLELLKMFCNTFNNFINFSKIRGNFMKQFIFSFDDKKNSKT